MLDEDAAYAMPGFMLPPLMRNDGNYIISLTRFGQWLGEQAEALGVEIYPGFPAAALVFDEHDVVKGVQVADAGVGKDGKPTAAYAPGIEIHARYTLIGEGARGSLTRVLEQRLGLRPVPQKYGLGVKELWRVPAAQHRAGSVIHALGWPLGDRAGGGLFIYHMAPDLISIGLVTHLDYANPSLSPFEEFQRAKTHPAIRSMLAGGERIGYGARAISEGGWQSLPQLAFAGGVLLGCAAGMVNVPRIKGNHNAMKSGMLAAASAFAALQSGRQHDVLADYTEAVRTSSIGRELRQVRNIKPALSRLGLVAGTLYAGAEMWLQQLGLGTPWTLRHSKPDFATLRPQASLQAESYPRPDGVLTFDKASSLQLSNTWHEANQPVHLQLLHAERAISLNLQVYGAPETHYCPAGVYETVQRDGVPALQINAQNCLHCKTCDIKDPSQNIVWQTPEGGGGPNYRDL